MAAVQAITGYVDATEAHAAHQISDTALRLALIELVEVGVQVNIHACPACRHLSVQPVELPEGYCRRCRKWVAIDG